MDTQTDTKKDEMKPKTAEKKDEVKNEDNAVKSASDKKEATNAI